MILYGGHPFKYAMLMDKDYKLIADKEYNDFWNSKENSSSVKFSEKFKDLFKNMVALNSKERLTIKNILAHEWFKGETSTIDKVMG